jgi:hypothetical protein
MTRYRVDIEVSVVDQHAAELNASILGKETRVELAFRQAMDVEAGSPEDAVRDGYKRAPFAEDRG